MANHSSARPHIIKSTKNLKLNGAPNKTISLALKRRAQSLLKNKEIDADARAVIRYGLETNDPWLSELVRRADAGETIIENMNIAETSEDDPSQEKIETLVEMICGDGDESSAALLVLMATLQNSPHPQAVANTAKHFAFTRCGELNIKGMVDAQIALLEGELLANNTLLS